MEYSTWEASRVEFGANACTVPRYCTVAQVVTPRTEYCTQ
jgi:hypothetical protein